MKPINRTNAPRTCLWCGAKLRPQYRVVFNQETRRYEKTGEIAGYGPYREGFFCTLTHGYEFGRAMAKAGRRLAVYKEEG